MLTILSQMDNHILLGIVSFIVLVNSGAYGMIFKYISNLKKSVQFKDVCDERHLGLKETHKAEHDGLKKLVELRFDNLEKLVKANGKNQGT